MTSYCKNLDNMLEVIVDDLLEATDEEILNDAIEDGINIEDEARSVRCIFNKCRYNIAQKIIADKKKLKNNNHEHIIDISEARKKITHAIENNPDLSNKFTMAARCGENIPDEDVIGYYEDLCDLGIFDENNAKEEKK